MDTLETLFRPLTALVNRQIKATTPARELCAELDGKVMAVRVKDTGLTMYFCACPDEIALFGDYGGEPDVAISGSILSLARLAGANGEDAIRDGSLELIGDAEIALSFQKLLGYGKPDFEEELSAVIGDVAAHRLGEVASRTGERRSDLEPLLAGVRATSRARRPRCRRRRFRPRWSSFRRVTSDWSTLVATPS